VTKFGAWPFKKKKKKNWCVENFTIALLNAYFVFHIFCLVDNCKSCIQISPGAWYFGLFNGVGPTRTQSKMVYFITCS
jgi:hypothetical protein